YGGCCCCSGRRDKTVKREVKGGERGRTGGAAMGERGHRSVAD
ncbi:hypothetical protein A2U01_0086618, partial [Trifolium medium]|nr:hypothetical protein [Trifolium medium]